jgi:hypothetical protein
MDRGSGGAPRLDEVKPILRFLRRHPILCAEAVLFVNFVFWPLLTDAAAQATLTRLAINAFESLHSLWVLLQVDTAGTLETVGPTAAKLLIATIPALALARRWRGWERLRLLWLPFAYVLWPLVAASSATLLIGLSLLTLWLVRFRWLQWTVLLPFVAICAPVPSHQFAFVWSRDALIERCAGNSGRRPINLRPQQITPGYMGVTQLRPDEVLLPGPFPPPGPDGETLGGSWWLRRAGSDWKIESPSKVNYTFWSGCLIGDEMWLNRPNFVMGVRRDAATGEETVRKIEIPVLATDVGEIVCLPDADQVLSTEALNGSGIWQVATKTDAVRRLAHDVGGLGAIARRGPRGQLIVANGTDLMVYSLEREQVVDTTPGGVQMFGGLAVCPLNWEAAAVDVAGRLRFFKPDAQGHYRFDSGISLRAPRAVAYSPDCQHVAVTSWDDETVWLVERDPLRTLATYRVGPALRGITFLGRRELAIVDACTMSDVVF